MNLGLLGRERGTGNVVHTSFDQKIMKTHLKRNIS